MDFSELKTPSLILDVERVRRNAARMLERAASFGVRLRPHVKTHKCVEVARLQTGGEGGITVSTLAEARAFAAHGFRDIIYAVPVEPGKFAEALDLIQRGVRLALLTDDMAIPPLLDEAAGRAGVTFDLFLKVDCGYHRCGVEPHTREALEIPRRIADSTHLRFAGILTHAGHSYHARTRDEVAAIARQERDVMVELAARLADAGLPAPTVSVGSTPTATHVDHLAGVNEMRPGNYIFFDAFQATLGSCSFDDCALTVLAAVTHRDRARLKLVIDAGGIALSKDRGAIDLDPTCGYGRVLDVEGRELGLRVDAVSQEHGILTAPDAATFDRLKVGDRVRVLANHSCLTAAQHDAYHVLEGGRIVDRWAIHRGW